MYLCVVCYMCILSGIIQAPLFDRFLLSDSRYNSTQAVCLDGSPGAYYFRPGHGEGKDKFFIFHAGGGEQATWIYESMKVHSCVVCVYVYQYVCVADWYCCC